MRIVRAHVAVKLLAVAVAGVVAGCASLQGAPEQTVDTAKVAQVERNARLFGTQVIWVNFPTKPVESTK
ncbi:MAG TPA: hypothetical protein VLW55_17000 [Burkholderiaceae bacterium]|nr:hypothetical protein [Burkholderiaceae bacterium]